VKTLVEEGHEPLIAALPGNFIIEIADQGNDELITLGTAHEYILVLSEFEKSLHLPCSIGNRDDFHDKYSLPQNKSLLPFL
jgi:hypothetical protein